MRVAVYAGVAWFVCQIAWLVLLLSVFDTPPAGDLWGALRAAAIMLPPLFIPGFLVHLGRRLRTVESKLEERAVTTRSGFKVVPSSGLTSDDAIICLERDPSAIPAAEIEFIREQVGTASVEVMQQELRQHHGRTIDVLTIAVDGVRRQVHFDVSRSSAFAG